MSEDILITGGAGFIGSHVAQRFVRDGHSVTVLDNLDEYYDVGLKRHALDTIQREASQSDGCFEFVHADIRDGNVVRDVVSRSDYVYHHAAQAGVRSNIGTNKYHSVNVDGTLTLLNAARKFGVERFVIASSSSVYGGVGELPYTEVGPVRPVSDYGASKLAAEQYALVHGERCDFPAVSLRYFTVYGPRMRPNMAISNFVSRCASGLPPTVYGSGDQTRDFTYIEDVISANETLIHSEAADGEVLNIGSGGRISILELAQVVQDWMGVSSEIQHTDGFDIDADHTQADISKANELIGYEPEYTIREGVQQFIEWFEDNQQWYGQLVRQS